MADKGFVISRFFKNCKNNKPIEVFYSGKQERCFCYVTDFVDAAFKLGGIRAKGIYNVGAPSNKISIIDLATTIKTMLGSSSEIVHCQPEQKYPGFIEGFEKIPNISKIQQTIAWSPSLGLQDCLDTIKEKNQ